MISIVIPLYNKEKAIIATLNSVKEQTFTDYECIIVNDGSTDCSLKVVSDYCLMLNDGKFRVINKPNGGVCSARNRGIQEARGEYIALLDGDDIWDKDFLAEIVKMQQDFQEAWMWGINYAEIENGQLARYLPTGLPKDYRGYVDNYFELAHQGRVSDLFCSSNVVIRKDVFDEVGYFDERLKYAEDTDMWWRIIARHRVAFYDRYMCFYQFDAENRALNRKRQFEHFLPCYPEKFAPFKDNSYFYCYTQRWCANRIRIAYFGNDEKEHIIAKQSSWRLDYTQLPLKYRLLFFLPMPLARIINFIDLKRK